MKREIECLVRLQQLTAGLDDMMGFLVEEEILDVTEVKKMRSEAFPASDFYRRIQEIRGSKHNLKNSIQMMEYHWEVLPVERIKVTIVTDRTQREFVYNF